MGLDHKLLDAVLDGDLGSCKNLVKRGANIKTKKFYDESLLMFLAVRESKGHCDVARFLIESGVDVNEATKHGGTVLMRAAAYNNVAMMKTLIELGADVDAQEPLEGRTAYMLAKARQAFEARQVLFEAGAKGAAPPSPPPPRSSSNSSVETESEEESSSSSPSSFNKSNVENEREALSEALDGCNYDHSMEWGLKTLKDLIRSGANLDDKDEDERTILHEFIKDFNPLQNQQVLKILLKGGANVHATDKDGVPAFILACRTHKEEYLDWEEETEVVRKSIKLWLRAGADIDIAEPKEGKTALMEATERYALEFASMLLEAGANVNITDNNGQTALFYVARSRMKRWYEDVVPDSPDYDSSRDRWNYMFCDPITQDDLDNYKDQELDDSWEQVFSISEEPMVSEYDLAKMMLDKGANIDARDKDGKTALMVAIDSRKLKFADMLVEAGADIDIEDNQGNKANVMRIQIAKESRKNPKKNKKNKHKKRHQGIYW